MKIKAAKAGKARIQSKRAVFNGRKYASRFEAKVAYELEMRLRARQIVAYDIQYKLDMVAYRQDGSPAMTKSHKVDFRVHNLDGTFTLLEAKGVETPDYRDRRQWLEAFWLPLHPDHDYQVVYQSKSRPRIG